MGRAVTSWMALLASARAWPGRHSNYYKIERNDGYTREDEPGFQLRARIGAKGNAGAGDWLRGEASAVPVGGWLDGRPGGETACCG